MPFSLTADLPAIPDLDRRMAASAEAAPEPDPPALTILPIDDPIVIVDPPPPILFATFREDILDERGEVAGYREITSGPGFYSLSEYDTAGNLLRSEYGDESGYRSATRFTFVRDASGDPIEIRETSSGGGQGFNYESSTTYDGRFNLIEALYSDSNGYQSSTRRSTITGPTGEITGYRLESSGGDAGHSFTSLETFDRDYQLLTSEFSNSDGYLSSYQVTIERDASGLVTGYITQSTWSDGAGNGFSSTDRFDANWNYVNGDSSKPDIVIDDGPQVLPVVALDSQDVAGTAVASSRTVAVETLDGSTAIGVRLNGSDGDDTFLVDDLRDRVSAGGRGVDTLISDAISLDLVRGIYDGIENARLTGRGHLGLRGDGAANRLSGNAGDNRIDGGKGSDTLFGGLGEDTFVLRTGSPRTADHLVDFTPGEDTLTLSGKSLQRLFDRDGDLREGVLGDRLVYDANSGELRFDRDGAEGKAASVVLAVLVGVNDLDADDFIAG